MVWKTGKPPLGTIFRAARKTLAGTGICSREGIALLMVLWVLMILTVIVFSFSYMTRTETHAALAFRQWAEKKFLAEAGIERGIMEIFYRRMHRNQSVVLEEGLETWKVDGTLYEVKTETGGFTVAITDESGKVDINTTPDVILRNLLANLGVESEEVDVIVDSIQDWKDPDDLVHLHGVESSYYLSLPNPYEAKNANFETLEELLLVKGMTPEILYGTDSRKGIIEFLTVFNSTGRINANAAPREVLLAVPGITPDIAEQIINYRANNPVVNLQEVGVLDMQYLLAIESQTFTVEAAGYKPPEEAGYAIRATVTLEGTNKYKYLYYKSPAAIKKEWPAGDMQNTADIALE